MPTSRPNPDSSSGLTEGAQIANQLRSPDADDAELSPAELAHLFAESSDDVSAVAEALDRRGDALAAATHSLAEQCEEDLDDIERDDLDALASEAIEGLADAEKWTSQLHAILVAVEEARARLDERDE
jgi:hypothetical protein